MSDTTSTHALWILLLGMVLVFAAAFHASAHRLHLPSLVGYLVLGMVLRLMDDHWGFLARGGEETFGFLADLGIVVILFRVGLQGDLAALLAKLKPASLIWVGNVTLAGALGYVTARYALGLGLAPALTIGVALTATSIGVSTAAWEKAGALNSSNGRLMLDVAELDDISGVAFMALLFAVVPVLESKAGDLGPLLLVVGAAFAAKFTAFAALCFLFARYIERPVTRAASRLERPPQRMLTVTGLGLIIAAIAGWLGFSLAIGALFAGLVFSRDPQAVRTEARFDDLYAFFAPFFFIGIGLQTDLSQLSSGAGAGLWLLAAAIVGKALGAGLPALLATDAAGSVLIGASMIPRAEIAMVIAHEGYASGALPEAAFAALLLAAAGSCFVATWLIDSLLARWPQGVTHYRKGRRA